MTPLLHTDNSYPAVSALAQNSSTDTHSNPADTRQGDSDSLSECTKLHESLNKRKAVIDIIMDETKSHEVLEQYLREVSCSEIHHQDAYNKAHFTGQFISPATTTLLNTPDEDGKTLLESAIKSGANTHEITTLIKFGANQEKSDKSSTLLDTVEATGNAEIISLIYQFCATKRLFKIIDNMPNNTRKLDTFVKEGSDFLNMQLNGGMTALHHAAKMNKPLAVQILIRYGADTNIQDNEGKTPLNIALAADQKEIISIFQQNNSDKNTKSSEILNTTTEASDKTQKIDFLQGHSEIIPNDQKNADPRYDTDIDLSSRPFNQQANNPNNLIPLRSLQQTLFKHIDNNNNKGVTDLIKTVRSMNINPVALLCAEYNGKRPLNYAISKGHELIVTLLLNHQAIVDDEDIQLAEQNGLLKLITSALDNNNPETVVGQAAEQSPEVQAEDDLQAIALSLHQKSSPKNQQESLTPEEQAEDDLLQQAIALSLQQESSPQNQQESLTPEEQTEDDLIQQAIATDQINTL